MTEQEWLESTAPHLMLQQLQDPAHDRKLRLFAYACIARLGIYLRYSWQYADLRQAEALAEGRQTAPPDALVLWRSPWLRCFLEADPQAAARGAIEQSIRLYTGAAAGDSDWAEDRDYALAVQANLLRCFFGTPGRPVVLDPAWRTPAVLALARTVHEKQRFEDMPFLGDALEEAGCPDAAILSHCRRPGPHVRGCCVLAPLLGPS